MHEALFAPPVHVGDASGDGEERLQLLDVVAGVGDDLRIGRCLRAAIDLVQLVEILGAIERPRFVGIVRETVFAQHAVPAAAVVRRLDQRIGAVAQVTLLIGGAEFGDRAADSGDGVAADPVMHVVGDKLGPGCVRNRRSARSRRTARPRQAARRTELPAHGRATREASAGGGSWDQPSGANLAAGGPAATAAALAAARGAFGRFILQTLDADDREDNHGRRLAAHPDHPAVARTAPQLGKSNHGPHCNIPYRALLAPPSPTLPK
jgi:hypothetical protein